MLGRIDFQTLNCSLSRSPALPLSRSPALPLSISLFLLPQGVPFLILGNKIDMQRAASHQEVIQALGLQPHLTGKQKKGQSELPKGVRPLELFMVSVIKRMGYREGFEWLGTYLN